MDGVLQSDFVFKDAPHRPQNVGKGALLCLRLKILPRSDSLQRVFKMRRLLLILSRCRGPGFGSYLATCKCMIIQASSRSQPCQLLLRNQEGFFVTRQCSLSFCWAIMFPPTSLFAIVSIWSSISLRPSSPQGRKLFRGVISVFSSRSTAWPSGKTMNVTAATGIAEVSSSNSAFQ